MTTQKQVAVAIGTSISIHALLTEGDMQVSVDNGFHFLFQSTPSSRRVTQSATNEPPEEGISIHALLTEGDLFAQAGCQSLLRGISIHALLTEGDSGTATDQPGHGHISIHALLTEGDPRLCHCTDGGGDFNPRPPHGG